MNKLANNVKKHTSEIFAPTFLNGKCYESIALQEFQERSGIQTKTCGILFQKHIPT